MELTKLHIELMEHTISDPGRNWFATSLNCKDSFAFEELVEAGYATKEMPPPWSGDDVLYRLEMAGRDALQESYKNEAEI